MDDTHQTYRIELPNDQAAKIEALADMFSSGNSEDLLKEMVVGALKEVEETMPYIEGETISDYDPLGNPIYEDIGPTPKFLALTERYVKKFSTLNRHPDQL